MLRPAVLSPHHTTRSTRARILLVSANREHAPQPVVANGVACVASALDAAGHDVHVADLCFVRDPHRAVREAVDAVRPDVIGISVRNLDNSDSIALRHYTPDQAGILRTLREAAPGAQIIAGGAAFGVAPDALFRELGVDYAVAGDGERATVALVDALAAGRAPGAIPGLVRRAEGHITLTPPGGDADLDALPRAQMHRWLDLRAYERRGATVPIQTKRGCVFKCVYCTYLNVEGWGYRLRNPEAVVDEIAELGREAHVRRFEFVDSTFNAPPRHAMAVCEAILRRGLRVHLDTTNFTPAVAPDELLELMRRAGFRWLGITAESASDPVLARLQKGFDAATVQRVAERVERAGLGVLWIFLVGGPGETPDTLEETLRFAAGRLERGDAVYLTVGLRIYPGTTLHRVAMEEGIVAADDPLLAPAFYFSSALDPGAAVVRLRRFAAQHPRFMFSADSSSPLLPHLTRLASLLHLPRPHWRYMALFQRLARAFA
ncbi:MAG TPA: radical SAM protein [Gemmatimonadaceae bacterium]|nr:radical SAM protein [Gemmatimonadaceae bacterium]